MHELSVISNILDIILEYGEKNHASKISKVNLSIGELSDIVPRWAQLYFDLVSQDTIASKAELVVEKIPVRIRCTLCGTETQLEKKDFRFLCGECESEKVEILSGRELRISSIEIE